MMKKYFATGGTVILGIVIGLMIQPLISGDNVFEQVKKFDRVLNTAIKNYVNEVDTQKLTEAAIRGMLNELDPHSVYISAEEMKGVNEDFQGSFEGIGVEFDIINDTLTVVSPIPGGPSESVGIQAGDKIVKIDGQNAVAIQRSDVPKKLKGPKGTTVVLDIKRDMNKDLMSFSIVRDKIPLNSVEAQFMIDGTDIGVVSVNRFASTTYQELMDALANLEKQGMKKLLLDLRGNPGGYLNQAEMIADEFLSQGDTVVYTIGRKPEFNEVYTARSGDRWEKLPIIVMVNAGSASASEIVSGAIQDRDRGLIVGETSFGKGLVQRQYPLNDGSAFRLTISKYYTPSGRCIQRDYSDKDEYRHLAGRLDLKEGSYINDAIAKIKEQVLVFNEKAKKESEKIKFDSLPLFRTRMGRTVFGGGGITPDVIIKSDTITKLGVDVRSKRMFFEYVENFLQKHGKEFRAKYENNFTDYLRKFKIDDKMMEEFKELAEKKGVKWDAELAKADMEFFQISIKATLARTIWDRNKSMQVFSYMDKQMLEATKLFPEALKISKLK
jgi:carboxyl-terminal processing protease